MDKGNCRPGDYTNNPVNECSETRLAFNRVVVVRYRIHLEARGLAANTINQL